MEKTEILLKTAERSLKTLKEVLDMPFSVIVRDAAIQRFEYNFEIMWKLLKHYLKDEEGIICNSPKTCFKEAFSQQMVTEKETVVLLEMTDDRNLTSHTYHEEVAEQIFSRLKKYHKLMNKLFSKIKF